MQKKGQNRDLSPMNLEDGEYTTVMKKKGKKPVGKPAIQDEEDTCDPFDDQTTLTEKYFDISQPGQTKFAETMQDLQKSQFSAVWKGADHILLDLKDVQPKQSKVGYLSEHEQNEIEKQHNNEISKVIQTIKTNFADELKPGGGFRYYRSPENTFKKKDSMPQPSKDYKWVLYFNLSIPLKFDHELSCFKFSSQSGKPAPTLSPELSHKLLAEIVKLENIKYNNKD